MAIRAARQGCHEGRQVTISAKLPETAFEQVWARARGSVLAYCRRATRNPADADDLCQRVAIRAWRGYATFRGDSSVLTWLLRIAEREAIRMNAGAAERQRRETPILPETPLPATPTRSAAADLGWVGGMVERAWARR
jgi:RNA polymerase sigma factor (sigma-70 family)